MVAQKDLRILSYLFECLEAGSSIKVDLIAQKMGVSGRTVRSNLERIDYYLKSRGYAPLIRSRKEGIGLDILPGDIEKARAELLSVNTNVYVLSRQERILLIKLLLFDAAEYLTYDYIAQLLSVSRKTVIEDVRELKDSLTGRPITVSGTKYGICFSGDEASLRRFLIDSMLAVFRPVELWEILQGIFPNRYITVEQHWRQLLASPLISICDETLQRTDHTQRGSLTDAQYYMTILLTLLTLKRCENKRFVDMVPTPADARIAYLQSFFALLQSSLGNSLPESEMAFIGHEISRTFNFNEPDHLENISGALQNSLLVSVSEATGVDYSIDSKLYEGLEKHLLSLIKNAFIPYQMPAEEFSQLIENHKTLYDAVFQALSALPLQGTQIDLSSETALVMLHFLASDDRREAAIKKQFRALVICNNGIGTCQIVSAHVQKYFPQIDICGAFSLREWVSATLTYEPDFILSTVSLEASRVPVIYVSAMLPVGDRKKIEQFLKNRTPVNRRLLADRDPWSEIMNLIHRTCTIQDMDTLVSGLSRVLHTDPPDNRKDLLDTLTVSHIQVGLFARDWEEAIRLAASPLAEHGDTTEAYIECMVENVRRVGPYIVISKGIALPHALPTDGVNRTCLSLATLQTPVSFGNSANDPVRLLLCFGTVNKKEHVNLMSGLIDFISNRESIAGVLDAKVPEQILRIIRNRGTGR